MKLSLITVSYNSAATIRDSIESVLGQKYPAIEYIIVDGASTDSTVAIASEYSDRVARVVSEPDRGMYDAMNKAIGLATGEVIGFLNADDVYASAGITARVMREFEEAGVDVCYGDLVFVASDNPARVVRYWKGGEYYPGIFRTGWCPPHPTFFARRKLYDSHGLFDLSYDCASDVELMMRFMEVAKARSVYIPETLIRMRMGGQSTTGLRRLWRQNREDWRAIREHRLAPNFALFVWGKMLHRGRQLMAKPK